MNEDFVSFSLAKKLKEKGYPQVEKNALAMYNEDGEWYSLSPTLDDFYYCFKDFDRHDFVCPTISQVLKWLREEKKIHICIDIYDDGWFFDIASFYKGDTGVYEIEWPYKSSNVTPNYDSFEQAAIAGIEYCLDNLI